MVVVLVLVLVVVVVVVDFSAGAGRGAGCGAGWCAGFCYSVLVAQSSLSSILCVFFVGKADEVI